MKINSQHDVYSRFLNTEVATNQILNKTRYFCLEKTIKAEFIIIIGCF